MLIKKYFFFLVTIFVFACNSKNQNENMISIDKSKFDTIVDGKKVSLFTLKNKNNFTATVTNYGARMVSLVMPNKNNQLTDIIVGFDNIKSFITGEERYFGAIVGRYGNRIAKGMFTLDGTTYQLDLNNGVNTLHGGRKGFHSVVWDVVNASDEKITLKYFSKDGDEGYPGNLTTLVTYSLLADNSLKIDFEMSTDKKTIVNVTNHNYWNLNGIGSGTINNHILQIKASKYTTVDSTLIPNGLVEVVNSPFDFLKPTVIGNAIETKHQQLNYGKGYDHNYALDKGLTAAEDLAAIVIGEKSGIKMSILTTEPGLQFYGGNFMQSKHTLKGGVKDDFRTAFCLETQHFPDAPNQPQFLSTVLDKGKTYKSTTLHRFEIVKE
jgi:aldose 1-epimerase